MSGSSFCDITLPSLFCRSNRLLAANVSEVAFADLKFLEVVDLAGNPEPISTSVLQAGHQAQTQMGT